jgi:hypothetical protein
VTAIKLEKFGGELPAWSSRLLPPGQAALALNCFLLSGELVGWRQPKLLYTLKSGTSKFAWRMINKVSNDTAITADDSFWMEFDSADTTVMRSPVVQDSFDRHYFVSPGTPPKYNTYDRILNGDHPYLLGIPASGCAPGVTVDGGGDTIQVGDAVVLPNAVGAGADYRPGNEIFLMPIVPNGTLLIQDVSFVPASTDGALNFMAVVYSDLNGHPDRLIGVGDQITGISAGATATGTFTNAVSVISNTTYWIGIAHDNPLYLTVADSSVSTGAAGFNTFSNGPPDPIGATLGYPVWQMWTDLIGASVFTARAYTYTWISIFNEEGPPSVPSVVNGWSNATWTVSLFTPVPTDMGVDRIITKTRIYRSISNQSGQGTYFLVAEIPVEQAVYVDTIDDATVALNQQLVSLYWFEPPADLQALISFPNGITIGFRANEIWFSEAYRPHAWPPGYVLTTEFPIVGIGVCGQSIIVCTQGAPYLISGINPSAMALTKINLPEPCLSRGSIVATDTTVLYVSQNGLIQISQSGAGANIRRVGLSRALASAHAPQIHQGNQIGHELLCLRYDKRQRQFGCTAGLHCRAVTAGSDELHGVAATRSTPVGVRRAIRPQRFRHRQCAAGPLYGCRPSSTGWRRIFLRLHRSRADDCPFQVALGHPAAAIAQEFLGDESLVHGAARHAGAGRPEHQRTAASVGR